MSAGRIQAFPPVVIVVLAALALALLPPVPAEAAPTAADRVDRSACTINGTPGPDVLRGGPGRDVICGWGGDDVLIGGGGDDVLRGGGGDDVLRGGGGDDVLRGGRGHDRLYGGPGDDDLRGYVGDDRLHGEAGADELRGYRGSDRLDGGPGADRLFGGPGADRLVARGGDAAGDLISCGRGGDVVVGGSGTRGAGCASTQTVPVQDNRAPTGVGLAPARVLENQPAGTEAGRLSAVDPDSGDTHTFALVPGAGADDNAAFRIDGVRLLTTRPVDFETSPRLSVRVRATDRGGLSVAQSLTVEVDDVDENRAPTAVDDTYATDEDVELRLPASGPGSPAGNDTDPDGDPLTVVAVDRADGGTVDLVGDRIVFTPTPDLCGNAAGGFHYTVGDGRGGRASARVRVDLRCVADPLVIRDDTATVREDAAATAIDVLANDSDPDGGRLVIDAVTQPAHGTVVHSGPTTLTYRPDPDYCSPPVDTFTYTVGGSTATVSVTVECVDDAPVAVDDTLALSEDDAATAADVLANDTDVDGGPIGIGSVTQPTAGLVVVTGGGTGLTYRPDADACGPDSFTYTLTPGGSTATVDVTVACVDDAPLGVPDTLTVAEDSGWTSVDVLANDTDVDGGPMAVGSVGAADHGQTRLVGDDVGYRPAADYCGPDTFTYVLSPGGGRATVDVTVTCVDDDPVAVDDSVTTTVDTPADLDVLANDTDVDGGPKSADLVTGPQHGSVVLEPDGTGSYTPSAGYCNTLPSPAPDTFVYRLVPGGSTATVSVTVTCTDLPPTAVDDAFTLAEDAPATVVPVRANDTDPDGGPMTVGSATQPAHGSVVLTGGGLTYAPDANYCGADSFTYSLAPGGSTATVSVTVTCVDDAPVAVDDSATVLEDAAATPIDVLANDTDIDGGPKTIQSVVSAPGHGTAAVTGGGTGLTYRPDADYCNDPPGTDPDEFTYQLNGGDTAVVSVTVTCVNDAPVVPTVTLSGARSAIGNTTLVVDTPTAQYGAVTGPAKTVTADLLATATDVDGPGPLAVVAATITTADGGIVDLRADGTFSYEPAGAASCDGTDSFTYAVSDGATPPATTTGTVQISVADCVWYVDNTAPAGGDGTSGSPFDTLLEAETASAADDTVFVYLGDGTSTGLDTGFRMDPAGRLLGEAAGLTVAGVALVAPEPGARPLLTATGADVIALDDANVVRGLRIDPAGGGGIAGAAGDTGGGTLADLRIVDTGAAGTRPALELVGTVGTYAISDLVVDTTAATSPPAAAVGVRLVNAGTVTFADLGTVEVSTKGAKALEFSGTALGAAGAVFDRVRVAGSSTGGVAMSNMTGVSTFVDLGLTTTGPTAAFALSNAGTVQVPTGASAEVDATGGPAVDVTGTSGALLHFDRLSSTGSTADGVNLAGLGAGAFSAGAGSSISGAAGIAFDLDGGSGDVTYAGSLGDGTGQTVEVTGRTGGAVTFSGPVVDGADVGGGIALSGNTGGSTTFSAAVKQVSTGSQAAVTMDASTGHALSFTGGGLDIDATGGVGLRASGGGTIAVTGTGNSIATTTGTALDVSATTIGIAGLTFRSISSAGAPVGIRLDRTGTTGAGSLSVTGAGGTCAITNPSACTGGVIANAAGADDASATPTGTGIVLHQTRAPSFANIWLHDHANFAVRGTGVVGFALVDSVVSGTNGDNPAGPYYDSAIYFDGLTGAASISRTLIRGGAGNNLRVSNSAGTLDRLVVDMATFGASGATPDNDAVLLQTSGSAGMKATVTNTEFVSAAGDLFQLDHSGSGAADVSLVGNGFRNTHPAIAEGGGGVTVSQSGSSGPATAVIRSNTFRDAVGSALTVVKGAGPSVQSGTIENNTVGVDGVPGSGSVAGSGVRIQSLGAGSSTWAVRNNRIRQYGAHGIDVVAGGGATASGGAVDATIADNDVAQPDPANPAAYGIHLNLGTMTGASFSGCAAITGNTVQTGGVTTDIRLRQRFATTLRLPGYGGSAVDSGAASTFVNGNNLGGNAVQVDISSPPGGGIVGGAACAQPAA